MRGSVDELTDIVYSYYPRGILISDTRHKESEEHIRLVAARRQAGANNDAWRAMLRRLGDHFPENRVENRSIHLPTGGWDACYAARLSLPTNAPGEHYHQIGFMVSFLVPYYIVYSLRNVDDLDKIAKMKARSVKPSRHVNVNIKNTLVILPALVVKLVKLVKPDLVEPPPMEATATRQAISFDLSPDEQPYGAWIAQEIEATWGHERMPPKVGKVIVPDVATNGRLLGEATLYDCLLTDEW